MGGKFENLGLNKEKNSRELESSTVGRMLALHEADPDSAWAPHMVFQAPQGMISEHKDSKLWALDVAQKRNDQIN